VAARLYALYCAPLRQIQFLSNTAASGAAVYIAKPESNTTTTATATAAITADTAATNTTASVVLASCKFADNVAQVSGGAITTTAAALVAITKVSLCASSLLLVCFSVSYCTVCSVTVLTLSYGFL
jgi:predicted outer membrane repeat protein